jgi:hypothetical protein
MKCGRIGCPNGATKLAQVSFSSKVNPEGPRVSFQFPHGLCDDHATTDPSAYISDEGWAQIVSSMRARKLAAPDRESVEVTFTSCQ